MARWLTGCLLCLILLEAQADLAWAQNVGKTRKGWLADYAAARALARQSGKPLLVVFRCEP